MFPLSMHLPLYSAVELGLHVWMSACITTMTACDQRAAALCFLLNWYQLHPSLNIPFIISFIQVKHCIVNFPQIKCSLSPFFFIWASVKILLHSFKLHQKPNHSMNESHSAPSFISELYGQAPFVLPCYTWFCPKISDSLLKPH